jgi:hypothetical protein
LETRFHELSNDSSLNRDEAGARRDMIGALVSSIRGYRDYESGVTKEPERYPQRRNRYVQYLEAWSAVLGSSTYPSNDEWRKSDWRNNPR